MVDIVMRTRERPLLLRRALGDVARQTYRSFHVTIVNDGGEPAEVDGVVAEHAQSLSGRVTVLHNDVPRGKEATSNQAIQASSAPYICLHDDDDTWHPDFLTRTVAHLDAEADAGVAVRTEIIWEKVTGQTIVEVGREIFCPNIHEFTLFELLLHNRMVPISMLYRRSVLKDIGYYREDLLEVGDWEFNLRIAAEYQIGFLADETLAFWHQRREQVGSLGNSVITNADDHRKFDLLVRNEALQAHVREYGMGSLLYLTKYINREFEHVVDRGQVHQDEILHLLREQNERIRAVEEAISDASLVSLLRRRYRRLKARLLGPRQ